MYGYGYFVAVTDSKIDIRAPLNRVYMLHAVDRSALSIDRAPPSRDLFLTQASIDGATIGGSRCAIDG